MVLSMCYFIYKGVWVVWCDLLFAPPPQWTGQPAAAIHLLPLPDFALRLQTKPLLPVNAPSSLLLIFVCVEVEVCVFNYHLIWSCVLCQDPVHRVTDSPGALRDEARLPSLLQENVPQQHRLRQSPGPYRSLNTLCINTHSDTASHTEKHTLKLLSSHDVTSWDGSSSDVAF